MARRRPAGVVRDFGIAWCAMTSAWATQSRTPRPSIASRRRRLPPTRTVRILACSIALTALLSFADAQGHEIAEAEHRSDAIRATWFRVGDLVNSALSKLRRDRSDCTPRGPQHAASSVETEGGPPNGR